MKTPLRQTYRLPGRYSISDVPYQLDWTALLEDGETIASNGVSLQMVGEADTEAYATNTAARHHNVLAARRHACDAGPAGSGEGYHEPWRGRGRPAHLDDAG